MTDLPDELRSQRGLGYQNTLLRFMGTPVGGKLFHYTDANGLMGIIQSRALWTTDIRFLSDSAEYRYAIDLAAEVIVSRWDASTVEGRRAIALVNSLPGARAFPRFVGCLSAAEDSVAMWRTFSRGREGYAIEFLDHQISIRTTENLLRCEYDRAIQQSEILRLTNYVLSLWNLYHDPAFESFLITEFQEGIQVLASVFKRPGFRSEEEWRIVWGGPNPVQFRVGRLGMIPYGPYMNFADPPDPFPCNRIWVGPNERPDFAKDSVLRFIAQHGHTATEVAISSLADHF